MTRNSWDEIAVDYGRDLPVFAAFARRLVERADVRTGERVLDIGCGNGLGLVGLDRSHAVGVDFSPAMARAACDRTGATVVVGEARSLPIADESVDVALASSVFQFVGYSSDVLRTWRQVVRPGGRVVLSVPLPSEHADVTVTLLREYFGRLPDEAQQRLSRGGAPPPMPDLATVFEAAGFDGITVDDEGFDSSVVDFDEWWAIQWRHGFRAFLREFDDGVLGEMRERARVLMQPYTDATGAIRGTQMFRFAGGVRAGR